MLQAANDEIDARQSPALQATDFHHGSPHQVDVLHAPLALVRVVGHLVVQSLASVRLRGSGYRARVAPKSHDATLVFARIHLSASDLSAIYRLGLE